MHEIQIVVMLFLIAVVHYVTIVSRFSLMRT